MTRPTELAILRELETLIGKRIERVIYRELCPEEAVRQANHHVLDFGVELHLVDAPPFSVIWALPNEDERMEVMRSDLSSQFNGETVTLDVTDDDAWAPYIGVSIRATRLRCRRVDEWDATPDFIRIEFEQERSIVIAINASEGDSVSVFFLEGTDRCEFETK